MCNAKANNSDMLIWLERGEIASRFENITAEQR